MRLRDALGELYHAGMVTARTDIPQRTDIEAPINYRQNRHVLFGDQEGKCNGCQMEFPFKMFEVDHQVPRSRGGTDHKSNLQLLCSPCNRIKGDRPMEYLMARLAEYARPALCERSPNVLTASPTEPLKPDTIRYRHWSARSAGAAHGRPPNRPTGTPISPTAIAIGTVPATAVPAAVRGGAPDATARRPARTGGAAPAAECGARRGARRPMGRPQARKLTSAAVRSLPRRSA